MASSKQTPISGHVAPGFEPVRAAFEANIARQELGAALHVLLDGESIVDLWGGWADSARTRPWEPNSLVNVYSSTKGWLALAMHMLADRGQLDFDAPVALYWPEFGQNGKQGVLIRHILTHSAGLPGPSMKVPDDDVYDWEAMIHSLESSTLYWDPGTRYGYHAATFGWLNGEVLRRITGKSVGEFLRSEIAGPLGADVFVGLSPGEEARCAEIIPPRFAETLLSQVGSALDRMRAAAFSNPPRRPKAANTHRWRAAQIPSSNGHASARGLARVYAPLASGGEASGVRILSEAATKRASREESAAQDVVISMWVRRSMGFILADPDHGDPRPADAFGHPGMGGSIGFADPGHRLAMGYVMNRMLYIGDDRWPSLCRALYAILNR